MAYKIQSRSDIRLFRQGYGYGVGAYILTDCTACEMFCNKCGAKKHVITQAYVDGHDLYIEGEADYDDPELRCCDCGKQLSGYL